MLLVFAIIVVIGFGVYMFKAQHDQNARTMLGGAPSLVCHQPEPEEEEESATMITVTVTYTDGTKETFQVPEEYGVQINDGGAISMRLDDEGAFVTLSPFSYKKIEEKIV